MTMNHHLHLQESKRQLKIRRSQNLLRRRMMAKSRDSMLSHQQVLAEHQPIEAEEEVVGEEHQQLQDSHRLSQLIISSRKIHLWKRRLIQNFLRLLQIFQPMREQSLKSRLLPIQTRKKDTREIAQSSHLPQSKPKTTTKKGSKCGNRTMRSSKRRSNSINTR